MPTTKKSPDTPLSDSDVESWNRLADHFTELTERLRKVRNQKGLPAALREQQELLQQELQGLNWDTLLNASLTPNPEVTLAIENTRHALEELRQPISTAFEEKIQALGSLHTLKERIADGIEKLELAIIEHGGAISVNLTINPDRLGAKIDYWRRLASSAEAETSAREIRRLLKRMIELATQFSDPSY